jgi:ABC-type transport system involved in multi-copper enzyme maturation permease subunit
MIRSVAAELLVTRKRASTWILMGTWVLLGMMFAYITPYLSISGGAQGQPQPSLAVLLPERLADNLLGGFPFFGGVIALMLGVLAVGSDYGWDTLKTLLTQRAGRLWIFSAKLAALALTLVPFVLAMFAAGALASLAVARAEGEAVAWPPVGELVRGLAAGWFILAAWAALGVLLAVASRGTALAIGIGILYALVIEGLLSALVSQVGWLEGLVEYFLRANAYSLVASLGVPPESLADNGPGSFSGPFVSGAQALVVLASYGAGFLLLAGLLLRQRDV